MTSRTLFASAFALASLVAAAARADKVCVYEDQVQYKGKPETVEHFVYYSHLMLKQPLPCLAKMKVKFKKGTLDDHGDVVREATYRKSAYEPLPFQGKQSMSKSIADLMKVHGIGFGACHYSQEFAHHRFVCLHDANFIKKQHVKKVKETLLMAGEPTAEQRKAAEHANTKEAKELAALEKIEKEEDGKAEDEVDETVAEQFKQVKDDEVTKLEHQLSTPL